MTRQEFIDNVCAFSDLIQFCYDEDLDICDEIYSEDRLDEYLREEIPEYLDDHDWVDLKYTLEDIPSDYEYYIRNGWMEFSAADDSDFDEYKENVLDEMDDNDYWDEDDEEEEEPIVQNNSESGDETPVEEEPVSIIELVNICHSQLININNI